MNYGYFDDKTREYVITNPATPWPWINYLGNEDFFSLISATAGGYCFCKDAKFRRLTRYRYNGVPMDNGGRYFYINDGATIWSPGWKPCKTELDSYECRHGMGYTRITGAKNGLKASVLFFVPIGYRAEIQKLTLTNTSSELKSFKLFSFVEWCLWNAESDMENFQRNFSTGEVEIEDNVIYHKTEYRERRDHFAYYGVNTKIGGFDTDRESFCGLYNGFDAPQNVVKGKPSNSVAHGWSPIASHYFEITLNPGESKDLIFTLGYIENPQDEKFITPNGREINSCSAIINKSRAYKVLEAFNTSAKVDAAFEELNAYWDKLLSIYKVESGVEELDRMVNIWNQYQCMVTFNMSRSASFFESGVGRGMGFRDSNQDLVGFVHLIPERARQRIIDIASTQFEDGGCYHQYQPLTKRGNNGIGGGFNDDPLWLIFGTCAYIKETGDYAILDEMVPFDNQPGSEKTLLEHLIISFRHVTNNLGPHHLPLIGRADWNDCLNLNCFSNDPNESFQTTENKTDGSKAESLMIAGLFVVEGKELAELLMSLTSQYDESISGSEVQNATGLPRPKGLAMTNNNHHCEPSAIANSVIAKNEPSAIANSVIAKNEPSVITKKQSISSLRGSEATVAISGQDENIISDQINDWITEINQAVSDMESAVKLHGWDGEWFLRAYDFYGNPIGSHTNEESKIFIESQGWCTMARIGAEEGLCDKALDSTKQYLDCEHGIVLNNPAFTKYYIEYGEISSYPQGYKENAGIFCHNNPWVIIGEALAGRNEDAWSHYCKISPAFTKDQNLHKVEPYVYCQMVAGKDAARPGEGKNSWLTGTAAWNWYAASEYLLGIKPQYDGLLIEPCLPKHIKEYTIKRKFRSAEYTLNIKIKGQRKSFFIPYKSGIQEYTIEL